MKLWQLELTHLKTVPHPNIAPSAHLQIAEAGRQDDAEPWRFTERGYQSQQQAAKRLYRLNHRTEYRGIHRVEVNTGEYAGIISVYEPPNGLPHVVRDQYDHTINNIEHCYMMATRAYHLLGDISQDEPGPCSVYAEDWDCYYGSWVLGLGFFGVVFPKATTRAPTAEEAAHWRLKTIFGDGGPPHTIDLETGRRTIDPEWRKMMGIE